MAGQYFLSITLCVILVAMATAAPSPSSKDKGMFPMENYEHYMPKQQQKFAEYALKHTAGSFFDLGSDDSSSSSSSGSSGSDSMPSIDMFNPQGKYKKFMPQLEQKWMEKFTGGAGGAKPQE